VPCLHLQLVAVILLVHIIPSAEAGNSEARKQMKAQSEAIKKDTKANADLRDSSTSGTKPTYGAGSGQGTPAGNKPTYGSWERLPPSNNQKSKSSVG